jgi:DNA-binding protein
LKNELKELEKYIIIKMNDTNLILIILFSTLSSLCLCCVITAKCKITKKINDHAEKVRKRFVSVHVEDINIETTFEETTYGDIESNLEQNKEIKCEKNRPSKQV